MIKRLILLCIFVSGCGLYWGGGDDQCAGDVSNGVDIPATGYRNPDTNTCEYIGGGGYSCPCGQECATPANTAVAADPDWGQCQSSCTGLSEATCEATAGCQASYIDVGASDFQFANCWATAPGTNTGTCVGLTSQACSERDDCSSVYSDVGFSTPSFEECVAESGATCGTATCGTGYHCDNECATCNSEGCDNNCTPTCVADATCDTTTCGTGTVCVEQCDAFNGPCTPTCVPTSTNPGSCTGSVTCNITAPSCPANTTPGITNGCWSGYCIPNAECGSHDAGECYAQVTCNSAPPSCPMGTLAGVLNGCWSGYCIPTGGCELAPCESLSTENTCEARSDCTPVFTGTDCTCTTSGCTCANETYAHCESLLMGL
jgi:hypothetical protein